MISDKKIIISVLVFCIFAAISSVQGAMLLNNSVAYVPANIISAMETESSSDDELDKNALMYNILWYLPNRLIDLADCFTVELSGGDFGIDAQVTRYAKIGAGIGNAYGVGWTHKREGGFFNEPNYNADFLFFGTSSRRRNDLWSNYKYFNYSNTSAMDIIKYPDTLRHEDKYAIGVKAAFLLGVKVQFHPIEFADFITSIFLYDLSKDDGIKKIYR